MQLFQASRAALLAAACLGCIVAVPAFAQTAAPAAAAQTAAPAAAAQAAAAAPPPGLWINGIHLSAQLEGGMTISPANPTTGVNFGSLFTDRANQPLLNQLLLTANKPLDPVATGFEWGFKLQGMYGSDARFIHTLGIFDQNPGPGYRNQFDIVEANVLLHVPFPTAGGMDIKAGIYPTPVGYETIDPSTNPFYSHSYIFNYGLPFKHTGILTTTHLTPMFDLYLGIDSGVNTSIGCCSADNNHEPGGVGGFGLNLMGGNLTVVALTHAGPENAVNGLKPAYNADSYMRYLSDIVITYKLTPKLTWVADFNWIRDDFLGIVQTLGRPSVANAFGTAQYLSYALNDVVTLNARAELYRDAQGAFVASFTGNNDFVRGELGLPVQSTVLSYGPQTYGEVTVGATFKPNLPAPITGLMIRPEIRYDQSLSGGAPFNNGTQHNRILVASDFVLTF